MGYTLSPIAVDLGRVTGVIRSRNKRLVGTLAKKFGDEFEEIDESDAELDDEELEQALTVRDALNQMVMGGEYNEQFGFVYGYALNFLCCHFGELLPNEHWSAMPLGTAWAEKVDRGLKAAGVPEKALRVVNH